MVSRQLQEERCVSVSALGQSGTVGACLSRTCPREIAPARTLQMTESRTELRMAHHTRNRNGRCLVRVRLSADFSLDTAPLPARARLSNPTRGAPLIKSPVSVTVVARTCSEVDAWQRPSWWPGRQ
jgi:hypothetical protein